VSPVDEKYYDELFNTFTTTGWKSVMEKLEEILEAKDSIRSIPEGGLEERKGELKMLTYLMTFEEEHRKAYEILKLEEDIANANL